MQTHTLEELIGNEIPVLDHGSITLVRVMGDDAAIEEAARVSFTGGAEEKRTHAQRVGLLRYLMRKRHTSPFEMVEFQFRVVAPIFVMRQWIRHRTANANEISGRYAELPNIYYCPEEGRVQYQSDSNKQGSSIEVMTDAEHQRLRLGNEQRASREAYEDRVQAGMALELARINVPVSQYTAVMWKIDLHNLLHFLHLRLDSHAQYEIRVYAQAIAEMVKSVCPIAWEAFEDFRLNTMSLTAQDIEVLAEIGMTPLSAEGVARQIEAAVGELEAAREEQRVPREDLVAPASYWKTRREALEFAGKLRRLFCADTERARPQRPTDEVIIVEDKHDSQVWSASTPDERHASALEIMRARVHRWYTGAAQQEALAILDALDGARAWQFLLGRADYEYEHVRLEKLHRSK